MLLSEGSPQETAWTPFGLYFLRRNFPLPGSALLCLDFPSVLCLSQLQLTTCHLNHIYAQATPLGRALVTNPYLPCSLPTLPPPLLLSQTHVLTHLPLLSALRWSLCFLSLVLLRGAASALQHLQQPSSAPGFLSPLPFIPRINCSPPRATHPLLGLPGGREPI